MWGSRWGGAGQLAITVGMGARGNGGVMCVPDVEGDEHPGELQSEQKQEVRADPGGSDGKKWEVR